MGLLGNKDTKTSPKETVSKYACDKLERHKTLLPLSSLLRAVISRRLSRDGSAPLRAFSILGARRLAS